MAFFALLLFIMVVFIQPQEFIPIFMGMPLVAYTIVLAFIGWIFVMINEKKNHFFDAHQNILMLLFWLVIGISTLSVDWMTYTMNTFLEWGKFVIIYFLIINILNSQRRLKTLIWVIVLSFTITAYIGIMQHFGVDYTGIGIGAEERIRGVGIFDTNQLAYTCVLIASLVFGLFKMSRNGLSKLILLGLFSGLYYTIFLTGSRGGMLSAVVLIGIIFIVYHRNNFVKVFGASMAGLLFLVFLKLSSRLAMLGSSGVDPSLKGRYDVWGEAIMALKYYPFFGVGKGRFGAIFSISPHSSYIQVVAETGLIGLFLWLALFYFSIKNLRLIEHRIADNVTSKVAENIEQKEQKILAKTLQITLFVYLLGSFLSGNGYYITLYIMFALVVALQYLSNLDVLKKGLTFSFKELGFIAAGECGLILLLHFIS